MSGVWVREGSLKPDTWVFSLCIRGCFPYKCSVSGCVSRLYRVCIHVYQGVSWATRYTLIRLDTVPIHADTKSAPLSSVSDCKIQTDDSKKRDRVRISDVSTSVSGIVSAIMYLSVSVASGGGAAAPAAAGGAASPPSTGVRRRAVVRRSERGAGSSVTGVTKSTKLAARAAGAQTRARRILGATAAAT